MQLLFTQMWKRHWPSTRLLYTSNQSLQRIYTYYYIYIRTAHPHAVMQQERMTQQAQAHNPFLPVPICHLHNFPCWMRKMERRSLSSITLKPASLYPLNYTTAAWTTFTCVAPWRARLSAERPKIRYTICELRRMAILFSQGQKNPFHWRAIYFICNIRLSIGQISRSCKLIFKCNMITYEQNSFILRYSLTGLKNTSLPVT